MLILLVFISFLQSVLGFTLMSSSLMEIKKPLKKRVTIGLAIMILGVTLLCVALILWGDEVVGRYAIFIILAIEIMWFLICSGDRFFVSSFNFLTFVNIYVSISYISDKLCINTSGNYFIIEHIIIRLIIYIIIIPLLFKFVRPGFRLLVDTLDKEWRAANLLPFLFLVVQAMLLYYPQPYWHLYRDSWYSYVIVIVYLLFLAVYYVLYLQGKAIVEKYNLEKRQLLMAQQEKLWESELGRQKASTELLIKQRHDMRHHNAVIQDMIQYNDTKGLKEYMENYNETLTDTNSELYCKNPIANSIFNLYTKKSQEEDITIDFRVSIPDKIAIDNIDLTCVLGNTLENALEGCLRLPEESEKKIWVIAKFIDNRLRVQVENTCEPYIEFAGEIPITRKQGGGTGTKSILYTAEKYDGTAGFSVKDGKFITQIVLNEKRNT